MNIGNNIKLLRQQRNLTQEQIAEKFNESSIVEDYEEAGGSIKATSDSESINVEVVILNV